MEEITLEIDPVRSVSGKKETLTIQVPDGATEDQIDSFLVEQQILKKPSIGGFIQEQTQQFGQDVKDLATLPEFTRQKLKNIPGGTDFLPDLAATAATFHPAFAPLKAQQAANIVNRVTPKALPRAFDAMVTLPGIGPLINRLTGSVARNTVRFAPSIAAAGGGGFVGSIAEDVIEQEALLRAEEPPSREQIQQVFDKALEEGGRQMLFEIGGSAIFRGFEKLFAPNAHLLAKEGKKAIQFARENNLPLLPSDTTGTGGFVESLIEAFAPSGKVIKSRVEGMGRLLESPVQDSSSFIWKLFKLEGKGQAKDVLNRKSVEAIKDILERSVREVPGLGRISNTASDGLTGRILDGQALLDNLKAAKESGLLKTLDEQSIIALENLGIYAKAVSKDVNKFARNAPLVTPGSIAGQFPSLASLSITGLLLGPLFVGNEGVAGTPATLGEIGFAAGAIPFAQWMAESVSNPGSGLFKWLTKGAIESDALREMIRLGINATTRVKGRELQGIQDPNQALQSDVPFDIFNRLTSEEDAPGIEAIPR